MPERRAAVSPDVLITAAATALVTAISTDAWLATRAYFGGLFGLAGPLRQSEAFAQLDQSSGAIERCEENDQARRDLVSQWQLELRQLLAEHPEAEAGLRAYMERIASPHSHAATPSWIQTNTARDNARQNIVQGGWQSINS
jgi:hypothetical protein